MGSGLWVIFRLIPRPKFPRAGIQNACLAFATPVPGFTLKNFLHARSVHSRPTYSVCTDVDEHDPLSVRVLQNARPRGRFAIPSATMAARTELFENLVD